MSQPIVSFIIPVYNVAPWLKRCVDSVRNQTLSEIEIILIDDGSTDNSGQMCDEFAKNDPRIRVIHKKNEGQGVARNCGLDAARGEYISFVDSDDSVLPKLASDNVELARKNDAEVVVFGYQIQYTDANGKILKLGAKMLPQISGCIDRDEFWRSFRKVNLSFVTIRMYKREFLQQNKIRFAPMKIGEDAYFLSCLHDAPFSRMVFNTNIYYMYSDRPGSSMTSFQWDYFDEGYEIMRQKNDEVIERNEPQKGMYRDIVVGRGARSAHEALKKLSLAQGQIPFAERCRVLAKFCQYPGVKNSLAECKREWIGQRWQWIGIVLMRKRHYKLAMLYYDALHFIRKTRNTVRKAKGSLNQNEESAK